MIPLISGFAILLASCSSVAHIEKDDNTDFKKYKTFKWAEEEKPDNNSFLNDIQATNLQNAVNTELIKAKWHEAKVKPDVILKHDVVVEKKVVDSREPVYSESYTQTMYNPYTRRWVNVYYPSRFLGYEQNSYQANEGKIIITMVDSKTDKVIWQGWTREEINNDITSKDIRSGVKNIFKKFGTDK
ncbi:MAG: DUF4136 domain-containing protein [Ferruginibacter sp.]